MYIARSEFRVPEGKETGFMAATEALQAEMPPMAGFRWAMLLRCIDEPEKFVAVAMWQTQAQGEAWDRAAGVNGAPQAQDSAASRGYDVATARGSMTPAGLAALVDWRVDAAEAPDFVSRWNAAFHAIEDSMGSRLLLDLSRPGHYAGLHVVTQASQVTPDALLSDVRAANGPALQPEGIECYEVVLLTEA